MLLRSLRRPQVNLTSAGLKFLLEWPGHRTAGRVMTFPIPMDSAPQGHGWLGLLTSSSLSDANTPGRTEQRWERELQPFKDAGGAPKGDLFS